MNHPECDPGSPDARQPPPDVAAFQDEHPADVADAIEILPPEEGAQVLSALTPDAAADALAEMRSAEAGQVVEEMPPHIAASAVERMAPDDAVDLLAELDQPQRDRILSELPAADRRRLTALLTYPPDSAGGIMSPEVTSLSDNLSVGEAIERLRALAAESEQLFYTYVVDDARRLAGVLSLRDLILAPSAQRLRDIMIANVITLRPDMDRELAAAQLAKYGYFALPVVDEENHLLGIVTADDVMDVIQEEATEDMQRMVGAGGDEHIDSPVPFVWRRRVPWLLINLGTAFLAAFVVGAFESTIQKLTVLAVLLPIVAGQAGNTGLQSMAVMIRAIAIGETRARTIGWILLRETWIGLGTGCALALVCGTAVYAWRADFALATTLGVSMFLCMLLATLCGALIPWLMKKLGFDPAQSASIILTTVTDVAGFGIFLALGALLLAGRG